MADYAYDADAALADMDLQNPGYADARQPPAAPVQPPRNGPGIHNFHIPECAKSPAFDTDPNTQLNSIFLKITDFTGDPTIKHNTVVLCIAVAVMMNLSETPLNREIATACLNIQYLHKLRGFLVTLPALFHDLLVYDRSRTLKAVHGDAPNFTVYTLTPELYNPDTQEASSSRDIKTITWMIATVANGGTVTPAEVEETVRSRLSQVHLILDKFKRLNVRGTDLLSNRYNITFKEQGDHLMHQNTFRGFEEGTIGSTGFSMQINSELCQKLGICKGCYRLPVACNCAYDQATSGSSSNLKRKNAESALARIKAKTMAHGHN